MDENAATTSAAGRRGVAARRDYLVGIALLILVVLLWTASNFLTNNILTSGWDKPFAVTYANTSSFSLYLIPFALGSSIQRGRSRRTRLQEREKESFWVKLGFALPERRGSTASSRRNSSSPLAAEEPSSGYRSTRLRPPSPDPLQVSRSRFVQGGRPSSIDGRRPIARMEPEVVELDEDMRVAPRTAAALPPLTLRETAVLAGQFTLVWFAANWSSNAGLGMTSVASGTTLSSASGE